MDIPPLEAHSVAEAHLYLMVTPCKLCGQGRTRCVGSGDLPRANGPGLRLETRCEGCGFDSVFEFALSKGPASTTETPSVAAVARINPGVAPSRIIDVAQWVMLFRVISEAAASEADPAESRRLGHESAQCLDEALKFYVEDSDFPPPDAFFHQRSRRQARERPDLLARSRLIDLRAKLPTLTEMERRLQVDEAKRAHRWWKLW